MRKLRTPISFLLTVIITLGVFTAVPFTGNAAKLPGNSEQDINGSLIDVESDGSVGAILGAAVEQNEQAEYSSESITDVTIEGKTATVELMHTIECMVVIGIYDDSGNNLIQTAIMRDIPIDQESVTLTFDNDLPEYYYLRAFILNYYCQPLSKQFESNRYTSEYKEFLKKTTDDFSPDDVINFDDKSDNNFAVFDSAVTEISVGTHNIPSEGDSEYIFTNADDSVKNLSEGDIVYYDNNGEPKIIKVGAISVSGDTVTITPAEAEMEEVFDYVKIDVTSDEAALDMSEADEGVTFDESKAGESVGAGAEYGLYKKLTFNLSRGADPGGLEVTGINGTLDLAYNMHFKLYYSGGVFETELKQTVSGEFDVEVGLKISKSFRLCKLRFPTPVTGLFIAVAVDFEPEVSTVFHGNVTFSQTAGFAYNSKSGFNNLCKKPQLDAEVNFEGKIYLGFKLTPSIEALFGVVELGVELRVGVEGVGARVLTTTDSKESDHLCRWCVDGTVNCKVEISVEIETGFWKKMKHTVSVNLLDYEKEVFNFYYSSDKGFGKGECDNYRKPQVFLRDEVDSNLAKICNSCTVDYNGEDTMSINGSGKLYAYGYSSYNDYPGFVYATEVQRDNVIDYLDVLYDVDNNPDYDYRAYENDLYKYSVYYWAGNIYPKNLSDVYYNGFSVISPHERFLFRNNTYDYSNTTYHLSAPLESIEPYGFLHPFYSIQLPDTVRYIGSEACCGAKLSGDVLPDSLEFIGSNALDGTVSGNLTIPANVKMTGYSALGGTNLKSATLLSEAPNVLSNCRGLERVIIGSGVEIINDSAFQDCTSLQSVRIPDTVRSIGDRAFQNSGLETITIPKNISSISSEAFRGCNNLREVIIEKGVKEIGMFAFADCPNLEKVVLPSGITELCEPVFSNCPKLKEIIFQGSVEEWNNITVGYASKEALTTNELDEELQFVFGNIKTQYLQSKQNWSDFLRDNRNLESYDQTKYNPTELDYNNIWDSFKYRESMENTIKGLHFLSNKPFKRYRMDELKDYLACPQYELKGDSWLIKSHHSSYNYYLDGVGVFCGANETRGPVNSKDIESIGININASYPYAQYLVAVEDKEHGFLKGKITSLVQIKSDDNGNLFVPDYIVVGDEEKLNHYGKCCHPKSHTSNSEDEGYGVFCDICGARISTVADLGRQENDNLLIGDTNGDKKINISDVTAIQRHLAEIESFNANQLVSADVNGDGEVTIDDATHLQTYLAEFDGIVLGKQS